MNQPSSEVLHDIAPKGALRVAINFGNPVLAQRDAVSGEPRGVSRDLATELARRLGVDTEFKEFDAAGDVVEALRSDTWDTWDIAFLARDPLRAESISFTAPYVVIEGTYLVRREAPVQRLEDLDRQGIRIAVGRGAAYDLFLTRTLLNASLVRAATSAEAIDLFMDEGLDAAAGVRQPLETYASGHDGLRVMSGGFTSIEQAMCLPKGRPSGSCYLDSFVEEMKANGFVRAALDRSGQHEVTVPPASQSDDSSDRRL